MTRKLLKILSGPHQGAEVELSDSKLDIGRGPDCDLLLQDCLLADRHLELGWAADAGVTVRFHGSGFVGGEKLNSGIERPIEDYEIVTIGTTSLCIGPAGRSWPELTPRAWDELTTASAEKAQAEPAVADGVEDREDGSATEQESDSPDLDAEDDSAGRTTTTDPQPALARAPDRSGRWARLPLFLALLAAVALVSVWLLGGEAGSSAAVTPPVSPEARLTSLRQYLEEQGLTLDESVSPPTVSGYLGADDLRDQVRALVKSTLPQAKFQVYSTRQLEAGAESVISGFGYGLTAESDATGTLTLDGWIPTEAALNRLMLQLRKDVPGLAAIETRVGYLDDVSQGLVADLERHGFEDVRLELSGGSLICRGSIPEERKAAWDVVKSRWPEQFTAIREVKDQTVMVASLDGSTKSVGLHPDDDFGVALPSAIVSMMTIPTRCFTTADGAVFFEGARLTDGYVVESIEATAIVFRRGDETRIFNLAGAE